MSEKTFTIGVFDSGVGGRSVAKALKQALPDDDIIFVSDTEHLPYGTRSVDELEKLVTPIFQQLAEHVDIIVIACNTVTTTLAPKLREVIDVPIVGMEPMVKPAAMQTTTGKIAVCATPTTLASERYQWLKQEYAPDIDVLEPDCSEWATMIEQNTLNREAIHTQIDDVCERGADVVVLGCTHYHWIEEIINEEVEGRAVVIQPEQPVIEQLKRVRAQLA